MSDLFGTMGGSLEAEANNRATMLSSLQAQQMVGSIAQQPADLQIKQAQATLMGSQARLVSSEATQHEIANQNMQAMLGLDKQFNAEYNARQQLTQEAAAKGETATVGDLTGGSATATLDPMNLYTKSVARIDWMRQQGVPESLLAPQLKDVAQGIEHLSIAAFRQQEAQKEAFDMASKKRLQIAGIANAAAASPEAFSQAMLDPTTANVLPKGMSMLPYDQALPYLQHIAAAAQTTEQQAQLANKQAEQQASALRDASTAAKNSATASAARARASLTETYKDAIVKNNGERSAAAVEAKASSTEARDNADAAKFRSTYQTAPLNVKDWKVGTSYSNADGTQVMKYAGMGADGRPQGTVISVPIPRALQKAAAQRRAEVLKQASPLVNSPVDTTQEEE